MKRVAVAVFWLFQANCDCPQHNEALFSTCMASSPYVSLSHSRLSRKAYSVILVLAGILIGFTVFSIPSREYLRFLPASQRRPAQDHPTPKPVPPIHNADVLDLEALRDLVATTRGFWARDWSLHLGWNNVSAHPSYNVFYNSSRF
jgi:hypothetical protein